MKKSVLKLESQGYQFIKSAPNVEEMHYKKFALLLKVTHNNTSSIYVVQRVYPCLQIYYYNFSSLNAHNSHDYYECVAIIDFGISLSCTQLLIVV